MKRHSKEAFALISKLNSESELLSSPRLPIDIHSTDYKERDTIDISNIMTRRFSKPKTPATAAGSITQILSSQNYDLSKVNSEEKIFPHYRIADLNRGKLTTLGERLSANEAAEHKGYYSSFH